MGFKMQREKMSGKILKAIFTLLLLNTPLFAEPILQLDTGSHTSIIRDVIVTKSGDIITASIDKTIRVWDSQTGREKREILGEIGSGLEGAIFAIALSDDETYLAVGSNNIIRIYDYFSGKLLKILKFPLQPVLDLSFKDNYLIQGSASGGTSIQDIKADFNTIDFSFFHRSGSSAHRITDHDLSGIPHDVYAVKIIKMHNHYYTVSAGYDNKIALFDITNSKIIASDTKNFKLKYLAINRVKKHIAVSGHGKEIFIYDYNLDLIKTIQTNTKPEGLNYSKDGNYLIAGTASINIYNANQNYSLKTSFEKHTNSTMLTTAVNFLDNHTAITVGGDNNAIYIWDIDTGEVYKKIEGVGESIWSVGIKGNRIAWGNIPDIMQKNHSATLRKSINLSNFSINTNINQYSFKRISTTNDSYSLSHSKGGDYGYSDAVLNIKKNGVIATSIIDKFMQTGYRHNCYGWYKDFIISGGSNGQIRIYDKQGTRVNTLIGHTESVRSIAVDGDRLVSVGSDQTIKLWNLNKIDGTPVHFWNKGIIYPLLNIFVSKDNEYVVWTKSGYYAASPKGDSYVGYHINQGPDKEAYFVSSAKYYDKLYRPDIIEAVLKTGSEKRAIEKVSGKREVRQTDIVKEMPPIVTLPGSSHLTTDKGTATVKFDIQSDTPIEKYIITRNGEKLQIEPNGSGSSKTLTIDLDEGENLLSIRAKNKYAVSDEILLNATRESRRGMRSSGNTSVQEDIYKPTLYLLSIGVSKYKNSEYNLDVADVDAKSIVEIFKKQEGKIYKKVVVKQLINQDANKDNILDALDWIERETTQRDMVIIFVAGHGINDDRGNYYFMAHDSNVDKLRRTALRWIEIKDTLAGLPSKVILMVDTCHSGNILGQEKRRDLTGAIKSIINSGTGSVIMTASTGRGYSIENKSWGHGAFTKAIIEGLGKARADYNNNNTISIKEIDLYVTDRVKTLTKGKQKPTTIIPESIPDFALGVK